MVLNKLFGKKETTYFLEIDTETNNESSSEVEVNQEESVVEKSTTETEASTPAKKTTGKKTTVKKTTTTTSEVEAKGDVAYETPDWVKAIKNYSNQDNNTSVKEDNNFAGKYVSNNVAQSRRRPGPSLNNFKNMASKIGK